MLYYIETSSSVLETMLTKTGKLTYAVLYVDAENIEAAMNRARKYLNENDGSHLVLDKVKRVKGKLLT